MWKGPGVTPGLFQCWDLMYHVGIIDAPWNWNPAFNLEE